MLLSNAPGAVILAGAVDATSFAGPPIVLYGYGLTSTSDPRWIAAAAFAASVGAFYGKVAPLIGLNCAPPYTTDRNALVAALAADSYTKWFTAAHDCPYVWCDGATLLTKPIAGPIFSIPSTPTDVSTAAAAWADSGLFIRITANNMYGVGLMGCGSAVPDLQASPPVYSFASAGYQSTLNNLLNVWQRGGPTVLGNVAALQAAELVTGRLGVSRKTHPALVPYTLLQSP